MKKIISILAVCCTMYSAPILADNDTDKVVGAVVGGLVGSTIGGGDGKILATAAGVAVGYTVAGSDILKSNRRKWCERHVPEKYWRNKGTRRAWIKGCMNREKERQERREDRAYDDGYKGN